jgi:hypothetical protein
MYIRNHKGYMDTKRSDKADDRRLGVVTSKPIERKKRGIYQEDYAKCSLLLDKRDRLPYHKRTRVQACVGIVE